MIKQFSAKWELFSSITSASEVLFCALVYLRAARALLSKLEKTHV